MGNGPEGPLRLRDILVPVAERIGIDAPTETGRVWRAWRELVGDTIADHAEPTSLKKGVLRVRADSPVWATEVGYLSEEIRARVNGLAGKAIVTEVRVWTGPGDVAKGARSTAGGGPERRAPVRPRPVPESPEEALERARRAWAEKGRDRDARGPS